MAADSPMHAQPCSPSKAVTCMHAVVAQALHAHRKEQEQAAAAASMAASGSNPAGPASGGTAVADGKLGGNKRAKRPSEGQGGEQGAKRAKRDSQGLGRAGGSAAQPPSLQKQGDKKQGQGGEAEPPKVRGNSGAARRDGDRAARADLSRQEREEEEQQEQHLQEPRQVSKQEHALGGRQRQTQLQQPQQPWQACTVGQPHEPSQRGEHVQLKHKDKDDAEAGQVPDPSEPASSSGRLHGLHATHQKMRRPGGEAEELSEEEGELGGPAAMGADTDADESEEEGERGRGVGEVIRARADEVGEEGEVPS